MFHHLRIARPVSDLGKTKDMYMRGLDLKVLGEFVDHEGFDGTMLGASNASYHFELTCCRHHPIKPSPTPEDLIVFYVPDLEEYKDRCSSMLAAGFLIANSFNPYWDKHGTTFEDPDGYRIVIQNSSW